MRSTNAPVVTEEIIETLVRAFYDRVRADALLGPIFADKVTGDWEPHLQTMMAFWSSVMLSSGRFKGQPMQKHAAIPDLHSEHFSHWLSLFQKTANDVCDEPVAKAFVSKAQNIAASLQHGLSIRPADAKNISTSEPI